MGEGGGGWEMGWDVRGVGWLCDYLTSSSEVYWLPFTFLAGLEFNSPY